MPISWNEIKDRALNFTKEWEDESREHAEAKSFWDAFFYVFNISRRRIATFEEPVKKLNEQYGFIDLFWKGTLLVEHKSRGKNLDKAYTQALDYFSGLKDHELPKYVLVSDFEKFRLHDLEEGTENEFHIKDFYKNVELFGFIAGYKKHILKPEDPVNIQAAELMGTLHDQLKEIGYEGHVLEIYLVRLLFCLFADDTGIFEKDTFKDFIEYKTNEDGSNLGALLAQFFQVLNTPIEKRLKTLDEHLNQFPFVNGKLFEEPLPIAAFNSEMREELLRCSSLDWGKISPAIFGSMFQSVMNPEERRNLGAHYTSEKNILKLIRPLFLDGLWDEFNKCKKSLKKVQDFHDKLSKLKFLDPACGCGNFLVITYRELRLLELEIIKTLLFDHYKIRKEVAADAGININQIVKIEVDQFYGIEYDEWPARISEVAMWLMDHQMNLRISEEFGQYYARLPLKKSATIVNDNALRINWTEIISKNELNYIIGNPPFVGSKLLSSTQRKEMENVLTDVSNGKILDYVAAWYYLSAKYIEKTNIKCAFVSTNSITQGEQVGVLWNTLLNNYGIKIHFAHNTFKWSNEAKGKAAVYCVIIGFANFDTKNKFLFSYSNVKGEPSVISCKNINPYLIDANDLVIIKRSNPISNVKKIAFGNMPLDGGHFLFTDDEKIDFIQSEPNSEKWFKPLISAKEYLHNKKRWCLWLKDINPNELKKLPNVLKRVEAVKNFRLLSIAPSTQKHALTPSLFRDRKTPNAYILVPSTTSENRKYIPMGFFSKNSIANNSCHIIPEGDIFHFGVLMSEMHMSWVRYTCGRLKSDLRYSKDLVYNNFPWPLNDNTKYKKSVETKAQKVIDVRLDFPESSLADLYDPLTMPINLVKAHKELDKAVDLCYRPQPFPNEKSRIEFLFELYDIYISPLIATNEKRKKKLKKS